MNKSTTVAGLIGALFLMVAACGLAADSAVRTMAEITKNLNHFPSDTDKEKLAAISRDENSSEAEKVVAMALMNLAHRVSDEDRPKLNAIADDASAPAGLRELADILLHVDHRPSDEDIESLAAIAATTD